MSFFFSLRMWLLALFALMLSQVLYANECAQPRTFDPVIKWEWTGSNVIPTHNQVMSAPMVAPLEDTNNDGLINNADTPAIVFNTFNRSGSYNADGVLRAIRGSDGSEIWTVTDPDLRTYPGRAVLLADIDADGMVEIIATGYPTTHLLAFEHTGELKWKKPIYTRGTMGVAANMNSDNSAEMFFYDEIIDGEGNILTTFASNVWSTPIIADINLDGQPEIIQGGAAFNNDGDKLWHLMVDGLQTSTQFSGIGNFDADDFPEIVFVQRYSGKVYLVSHTGELIWQRTLPGTGAGTNKDILGGAPTIADMDGDGEAEIGIAGGSQYVVYNADGSILWTTSTQDSSSAATGSSVFDFDGDGNAEVVYNDELYLRVYNGKTGQVLFEIANTSGTLFELPVIADVDYDGHADIVVAANNYRYKGTQGNTGIRVFQDRNNSWVNARKIWNQHAYSVTNVNDDGTVPFVEQPSWLTHNLFRSQIPLPNQDGSDCEAKTCLIYGVHDEGLNHSQLFTIDPQNNFVVKSLGELYQGHDIEGIAIHPETGDLYLSTGNHVEDEFLRSALLKGSRLYGSILHIGNSDFEGIPALAFRKTTDGVSLWGWAEREGLIQIDPNTGSATLDIAMPYNIEAMVWSDDGNTIYAAEGQTLYTFDYASKTIEVQCDSFPGEVEALEMLEDGKLLFATHRASDTYLHQFNLDTCEVEIEQYIKTPYTDIEGLEWTCPLD